MPFRFTINAYRGCSHACMYCFARPTHAYLDLDPGEDFERRIVVKVNAVERLRGRARAQAWAGDHIAMGTNTDPYQPAEGRYRLTRGIVEALSAARNPFSILTKSTLILRDLDVLAEAARRTTVRVNFSIGTLDRDVWRTDRARHPPPDAAGRGGREAERGRRRLRRADRADPPRPLGRPRGARGGGRACAEAGAESISAISLHLRPGVRELFLPWLQRERPELVAAYDALYASPSGYAPQELRRAHAGRIADLTRGSGVQEYTRMPAKYSDA